MALPRLANELHAIDEAWMTEPALEPANSVRNHHAGSAYGERRLGPRVRTDFLARLVNRTGSTLARVIEVSPTGVVLSLREGSEGSFAQPLSFLELFLPTQQALRTLVRPVRSIGPFVAFELVVADDVDRLALAELADAHEGTDESPLLLRRRRANGDNGAPIRPAQVRRLE
jgi:hypothetical protein